MQVRNFQANRFLRDCWQKKPLLIRNMWTSWSNPLEPDELAGLACEDGVEARIIMQASGTLAVEYGPFVETRFDKLGHEPWTLLVNAVDHHVPDVSALLNSFRFIPNWRIDDVMVSYAVDQGGVGPHFDQYDVFLVQGLGRRRWQVGAPCDDATELLPHDDLRLLANFEPTQEWVLEPGDVLYVPPGVAHNGIAIGEDCMTYSIGFRSPAYQELGEAFLQFMSDTIDLPGRYADPDLKPTTHPAQIDAAMLENVGEQLRKIRFTDDDIAIFLGEYLSEPKAAVMFDPPARPLTAARFALSAAKRGVILSLKTQMLYRGRHVFINGESFGVEKADRVVLAALADRRSLEPAELAGLSDDVAEALHLWYCDGWLMLS